MANTPAKSTKDEDDTDKKLKEEDKDEDQNEEEDGDEEWEVSAIKDHRIYKNVEQYLVAFDGWASEYDEWIDEDNCHADEKIKEFWDRKKAKDAAAAAAKEKKPTTRPRSSTNGGDSKNNNANKTNSSNSNNNNSNSKKRKRNSNASTSNNNNNTNGKNSSKSSKTSKQPQPKQLANNNHNNKNDTASPLFAAPSSDEKLSTSTTSRWDDALSDDSQGLNYKKNNMIQGVIDKESTASGGTYERTPLIAFNDDAAEYGYVTIEEEDSDAYAKHIEEPESYLSKPLEEHFKNYVQALVYKTLIPEVDWLTWSVSWARSLDQIDQSIKDVKDIILENVIWTPEFCQKLSTRPRMRSKNLDEWQEGCNACGNPKPKAQYILKVSGSAYNHRTLTVEPRVPAGQDAHPSEKNSYRIEGSCYTKALLYHELCHLRYHLYYDAIRPAVRELDGGLPLELVYLPTNDKDKKRYEEARRRWLVENAKRICDVFFTERKKYIGKWWTQFEMSKTRSDNIL